MNNKYGTYETVTENYILSGVKLRLQIKDTTAHDFFIKDLINTAVKRLRNLGTLIPAVAQLPIVDYRAQLPNGFVRFTQPYSIVFVDADGSASGIHNAYPNYTGQAFFKNSPDTALSTAFGGTVDIANGYLYFSTNITATFVKIAYISTNVDQDGNVLIPAIAEDAIGAFCAWNFTRVFPEKYGNYIIQSYENEWKMGKKALKGIFASPNIQEYEAINRRINSMV
jgi:hypothetical protein